MSKNLYVGNLSYNCTADDLRELFGHHGAVTSAQVVSDRETGRSRGFGFVEMADGGEAAIGALNGADFQGRTLTVNEARPREPGGGGGRSGERSRPRARTGKRHGLKAPTFIVIAGLDPAIHLSAATTAGPSGQARG